MSNITSHILDTSLGRPAAGVSVVLLHVGDGHQTRELGRAETDSDGRIKHFTDKPVPRGDYRLVFDTRTYFTKQKTPTFYPEVTVAFTVHEPDEHHHVPLLLNPYGYSTYRGS